MAAGAPERQAVSMSGASFTRRLVLEAQDGLADGAGGLETGWTEVAVHWASLKALSAQERSVAGGEISVVRHRAEIRFIEAGDPRRPTARHRFRDGARIFAIRGVAEADDRRDRLAIWLEEGGTS